MHGEIEEGAVIYDKATGKSRGYGFITYKHMESTQSALRAPSKLIDVSTVSLLMHLLTDSPLIAKSNHTLSLVYADLFSWLSVNSVGILGNT